MFKFKFQVVLFLTVLATFSLSSASVTCPSICKKVCKSGFRKGLNDCEDCECVDPCERQEMACKLNEHCVAEVVVCKTKPCYQVARCESCGGICKMLCRNGFKKDERGCPICKCARPCDTVECENGTHCRPKEVSCVKRPCKQSAECVPCQNNCKLWCRSGLRKDFNGCDVCQCVNPCESNTCPRRMYCRSQKVACFTAPCYDVAQCKCRRYRCRSCLHGYVKDKNSCNTCMCKKPRNPCVPNPCPTRMYCLAKPLQCLVAPCAEVAECKCFLPRCQACRYGYVMDQNGCQTCQCQDACVAMKCHSDTPYCYNGQCHATQQHMKTAPPQYMETHPEITD